MSTFPNNLVFVKGSLHLVKGDLVLVEPDSGAVQKTLVLQRNPETFTRTLQPQSVKQGGDRSATSRLTSPPNETIKVDSEIVAMT